MEKKAAISQEVVDQEFDMICEAWDIDNDTGSMSEDDKESFENQAKKIKKVIKDGRMSCNGDVVTYVAKYGKLAGKEITLDVSEGRVSAFDKHGKNDNTKKLYEYMATMSNVSVKDLFNADQRDQKPLQALVVLFMAS